jgi:hypothetical protein
MESLKDLQLAVWRLTCGKAPLSESIAAIAERLSRRLPLSRLRVLAFDPDGARLTTLARFGETGLERPASESASPSAFSRSAGTTGVSRHGSRAARLIGSPTSFPV